MIKLNNKNITYVALADSNNSLKAPKEIWYADSSNSVKLVYRRKDALIEGEDYEKYHWLDGRNGAYINTGHKLQTLDDTFIVRGKYDGVLRNPSGYEQAICGVAENISYTENGIWDYIYIAQSNHIKPVLFYTNGSVFYDNEPLRQQTNEFLVILKPDGENYYAENNGVGKTFSTHGVQDKQLGDVYLFTRNSMNIPSQASERYFHGDIAYFKITDPTFTTDKLHLIPCKLLKPVPKWLDANGIRRQVGECGMIDLVSGKFYGNVNSVGTFTVENYYERKEWLVGDGSAFLNTAGENALIGINSVEWELSGNGQAVLNSFGLTTGAAQFVSDLSYVDGSIGKIGIYDNNRGGYFWTTKLNVNTLRLVSGTTIKAITINDVDLSNPNYQWNGNFILQFINRAAGYKVSKVTVDGSVRYIPCTLTMDLPASMDANNIPRTNGTSGMWDLVSDRFYGNVANSGTFKAVNLAEGVDYEVHQWLKGDGSAYIQGVTYDLWNNHLQARIGGSNDKISYFSYRGSGNDNGYLNVAPSPKSGGWYLMFVFRQTESPASHIGDIDPISSVPNTLDLDFYIDNSIFYCKQNEIINENTPQTSDALQSSWTSITPIISSNKVSYIRELLPNNTYRSNLIPVKLLRSIPSKYDANGIARQAGECGMYDTVNDKFYGNVASSGSFTVSDDN